SWVESCRQHGSPAAYPLCACPPFWGLMIEQLTALRPRPRRPTSRREQKLRSIVSSSYGFHPFRCQEEMHTCPRRRLSHIKLCCGYSVANRGGGGRMSRTQSNERRPGSL